MIRLSRDANYTYTCMMSLVHLILILTVNESSVRIGISQKLVFHMSKTQNIPRSGATALLM